MDKAKTILATAYAVNPYKGSEDGMGWNFILQIARFNKVIAITRENNRKSIEQYMEEHPCAEYERVTFKYFDLPYWMRFWKKGSRGAMLYFWLWQRAMPGFIRHQNFSFDIVHNVNFHNDWTPSYLWKLKKPFVWGPIGHHPLIPVRFLKKYKTQYLIKDRLAWVIKKIFWNFSPALKNTIRHAGHILCMNSDVSKAINLQKKSFSIMPSVATEDPGYIPGKHQAKFTLISAGRLVPLKGFDLTLFAFAQFIKGLPDAEKDRCELIIVGSGPEKKIYEEIAHQKGVRPYVRFIEWMHRADLMKLYRQCSAFIFPSHEGAGMVVAEAMSFGLPVICLNNSGPGEFIDEHSGLSVGATGFDDTIEGLTKSIAILYNEPDTLIKMSHGSRNRFEQYFQWNSRGEQLQQIYQQLAS